MTQPTQQSASFGGKAGFTAQLDPRLGSFVVVGLHGIVDESIDFETAKQMAMERDRRKWKALSAETREAVRQPWHY